MPHRTALSQLEPILKFSWGRNFRARLGLPGTYAGLDRFNDLWY